MNWKCYLKIKINQNSRQAPVIAIAECVISLTLFFKKKLYLSQKKTRSFLYSCVYVRNVVRRFKETNQQETIK